MPTYIALANWTDRGALQVKESPKRVDLARDALKEMGGEIRALYMTLGDYDLVQGVAIGDHHQEDLLQRLVAATGALAGLPSPRGIRNYPDTSPSSSQAAGNCGSCTTRDA